MEEVLAAASGRELVTVWLDTSSWRVDASVRERVFAGGWLRTLFGELGGGREELRTVLPQQAFDLTRPATRLMLADGHLVTARADVQHLAMRMQRASDKLREAIGMMEEETLEDSWSDGLATAQRLVFAAQAPDAYLMPTDHAHSQRQVHEATLARLITAELTVDALMQGPDDWLTVEEEDRDGDLVDELMLGNARVAAWAVPAEDGSLVTLDDRRAGRNLLAVGPQHDRLRSWVLEEGTTSEEFFAGGAVDLVLSSTLCEVAERHDDEEAGAFSLTMRQEHDLEGGQGRGLRLDKRLRLPVDSAEVSLTFEAELHGAPPILLATEIPLSLGQELPRLWSDGKEVSLASRGLSSAKHLRLVAADGTGVEVLLDPPQEVWIGGVLGSEDVGVVLVPILHVNGQARGEVILRLIEPTPASEAS